MANTFSISIVGDDRSTTEALAIALSTRGLHADPFSDASVTSSSPAVLILAGRESGKRVREKLETARVSFPQTTIITLAGGRDNNLNHMRGECVDDSLPTVDSFETLIQTLERLRDEGSADPTRGKIDSIGEITARTENVNPELTIRQQSVFQLIAAELSNKEIAKILGISLCTQLKAARFPNYRDLAGFDFASSEVNTQPRGTERIRHKNCGSMTAGPRGSINPVAQSSTLVRYGRCLRNCTVRASVLELPLRVQAV